MVRAPRLPYPLTLTLTLTPTPTLTLTRTLSSITLGDRWVGSGEGGALGRSQKVRGLSTLKGHLQLILILLSITKILPAHTRV